MSPAHRGFLIVAVESCAVYTGKENARHRRPKTECVSAIYCGWEWFLTMKMQLGVYMDGYAIYKGRRHSWIPAVTYMELREVPHSGDSLVELCCLQREGVLYCSSPLVHVNCMGDKGGKENSLKRYVLWCP